MTTHLHQIEVSKNYDASKRERPSSARPRIIGRFAAVSVFVLWRRVRRPEDINYTEEGQNCRGEGNECMKWLSQCVNQL